MGGKKKNHKNPDVVLSFMFRVHSEKSIWSLCFLSSLETPQVDLSQVVTERMEVVLQRQLGAA